MVPSLQQRQVITAFESGMRRRDGYVIPSLRPGLLTTWHSVRMASVWPQLPMSVISISGTCNQASSSCRVNTLRNGNSIESDSDPTDILSWQDREAGLSAATSGKKMETSPGLLQQ